MVIEWNGMPIEVELDNQGNIVKAFHQKTKENVSKETVDKLGLVIKRMIQKNPKLLETANPSIKVSEKQDGDKKIIDVKAETIETTKQQKSETSKKEKPQTQKKVVEIDRDMLLIPKSSALLQDIPLLQVSPEEIVKTEQLAKQRNVPGASNPQLKTGEVPRQYSIISEREAQKLYNPIVVDDNHVLSNGVLYRIVKDKPTYIEIEPNQQDTTKKRIDVDRIEVETKNPVPQPPQPRRPLTYPSGTDTGTDVYETFKPIVAEMNNNWRSATELSGLGQIVSNIGQKLLYNMGRDAYMRKKIESALKEQAPERYRGDVGKKQLQEDTEKYLKIARESFDERTGEYKRPITPSEKASMEARAEMANIQKQYQAAKVSELLSKAGLQKALADKYAWDIVEGMEMLPYEKGLKGAEIQRKRVEAYKESALTPYEQQLKQAQANYYQSRADNPNAGQSGGYTLEQFLEAFKAMQDAGQKKK